MGQNGRDVYGVCLWTGSGYAAAPGVLWRCCHEEVQAWCVMGYGALVGCRNDEAAPHRQ